MSKIRAKNFTDFEKSDLLDKIFVYRHIIENKQTDHTLNSKKDEAWTKIAEEYNKNRVIKRTLRDRSHSARNYLSIETKPLIK